MTKVKECLDLVNPMFEALYRKDYDELKALSKQIMKKEHDADEIKNRIRDNFPKRLFLPVDRTDLLKLLSAQDDISDGVEDLAAMLNMRKMECPSWMEESLREVTERVLKVCYKSLEIVEELGQLLAASFGGPESQRVLQMIEEQGTLEWEADKRQYKLAQLLFTMEKEIEPAALFMWVEIFKKMGQLSNDAEKVGKQIRMFINR
jgi:hypothetical protein